MNIPGRMDIEECIHVTSLTPSGIECLYSWHPKRLYRLREVVQSEKVDGTGFYTEWRDVPSVTTALGVLEKPALPWWGMRVGVEGVMALVDRDELIQSPDSGGLSIFDEDKEWHAQFQSVTSDDVVALLTKHKLTVNHVKDKAADRGTSVHQVFETWCGDPTFRPNPELYPEAEQGYVTGLLKFLNDLGDVEDIESELMVGSLQHGYAGRFDARLVIPSAREMVTKCYPKRKPKVEEVPAGRWLVDVKTSKSVYDTHALQLAAYEMASVECGYGPTDYRAVIHLTADGQYEIVQTHATGEDFLSILGAYNTMRQSKGWT